MKAALWFALPEEQYEFKVSQQAMALRLCLSELDNYLRNQLKYQELDEATSKAYQEIRNKLHAIADENEVSIYE